MSFDGGATFNAVLYFGALISLYVLVTGHRKHLERLRGSKSPFVEDFLRLPGHTARIRRLERFDELTERYNQFLLFSVLLIVCSLFFNTVIGIVLFCAAIVGIGVTSVKTWKLFSSIQKAILLCDGEEYTGQELNYLWREGAFVYHDIPYDGGHINHIVIGNDKIFAVETYTINKEVEDGRSPRSNNSLVEFNGETLKFPFFETRDPIEQSIRHSEYLKKQILENCGFDFQVQPVVAIPGWHVRINSDKKAEILVINPKRGAGLKAWLGKLKNSDKRKAVHEYLSGVARSIPARSKRTDSQADKEYEFWLSPRFKGKVLKD